MVDRKSIRTRGKISMSRYFGSFSNGDYVSVVKERAQKSSFPEKLQGRTGIVDGKRGRSYIVKIKDHDKVKEYIIAPIHLKKINYNKKNDKE